MCLDVEETWKHRQDQTYESVLNKQSLKNIAPEFCHEACGTGRGSRGGECSAPLRVRPVDHHKRSWNSSRQAISKNQSENNQATWRRNFRSLSGTITPTFQNRFGSLLRWDLCTGWSDDILHTSCVMIGDVMLQSDRCDNRLPTVTIDYLGKPTFFAT